MTCRMWSLKLDPNQSTVVKSVERIRITNACLNHTDTAPVGKASFILWHPGDLSQEVKTIICVLKREHCEHTILNLYLEEAQQYTLRVEGTIGIYLTGVSRAVPNLEEKEERRGNCGSDAEDREHLTETSPSTPLPVANSKARPSERPLTPPSTASHPQPLRANSITTPIHGGSTAQLPLTPSVSKDRSTSEMPQTTSRQFEPPVRQTKPLFPTENVGSAKQTITLPKNEVLFQDFKVGEGSTPVRNNHEVSIRFLSRLGDIKADAYERSDEFKFCVGGSGAPPGFSTGVLGMRTAGQRRIYIPPAIGYQGVLKQVPDDKVVYIECELLEIS